jgi:tRNA dimethylallyltransferase
MLSEFIKSSSRPLIVVLGQTASGKTSFSLRLALRLRSGPSTSSSAEIINADSRQLFQYMDIGTAKITPEEMQDVPHHLFSVIKPNEDVHIGWYKKEAMRIIDEVLARGNVPILVGGSMLYISSIIDGLEPQPHRASKGEPSTKKTPCPYDLLIYGMDIERQDLYRRINERTRVLLQSGWIEEVKNLLDMGYTVTDPGFKACGYREIADAISTSDVRLQMSDLVEIIAQKTRNYAKRQCTWWRNDERIDWVSPATYLPAD